MPHSVFTIVADITIADSTNKVEVDATEAVLRQIEQDHAGNPYIRFPGFGALHFASFVIFDRETTPFLVFENSVDGSSDTYLDELMATSAVGIDAVFRYCAGYPLAGTPNEKRAYLGRQLRRPHLHHCGTAYRTVPSIKADAALRARIVAKLDGIMQDALPDQLEMSVPVLPDPPGWRTWMGLGLSAALVGAAAVWLWTADYPWIATALALAFLAVVNGRVTRGRIGRIASVLAAGGGMRSPRSVWRALRAHLTITTLPEPRWPERLRNWSVWLLVWLIASALILLAWDHPRLLLVAMTLVFAAKAAWLSMLVGWPTAKGKWSAPGSGLRRIWIFVLCAAAGGALIGALPWHPYVALIVARVLLGTVALFLAARILSARRARATSRPWRLALFALLTAALIAWGGAFTASWLFTHLALPSWLEWALQLVIGIVLPPLLPLLLAVTFALLVLASALRTPPADPNQLPIGILMVGAGIATQVFWWLHGRPWPAALWLGLTAILALFYLWLLPLPMQELPVTPLSPARLAALTAREDLGVQNHLSAVVRVRPDYAIRVPLLRAFLVTLDRIFFRTVLPDLMHSTLFGVSTVHFAQWVLIDANRYLFLSNYDLAWTTYLDDFGAQIGPGIQKIWGQGVGNPSVTNLTTFKEYARSTMVPHQVWYSAYPGLTSVQIHNNEAMRVGLRSDADEARSLALLRRLAGAED